MKKIDVYKAAFIRKASRAGLVAKKYSPEILVTAGIVGVVAGTVLACKATLSVEGIIDDVKEKIDVIKNAKEDEPTLSDGTKYSEADYRKDMSIVYIQTGAKLGKLYAPSVLLTATGIGCILGAHNIMRKRNFALMAAYKLAEQTYADYRKRVVEEFGEDKDREFHYGIRTEKVESQIVDENGKKKKITEVVEKIDPNKVSPYARFFDECSTEWSKTPEYNLTFLRAQQNWANDLLHCRGHLFLNEVYDLLGLPRSQAGALVGWVMGSDGDNYVDFGIYDINNPSKRDFVNGYERSILLDFNIDGPIYDLI